MKLVADECIDRPIVDRLRSLGHDVAYVPELDPGITDDEVLTLANDSQSVLLTGDKDFGELVYRLGRVSCGVVLIRLRGLSSDQKSEMIASAFEEHPDEFTNAFTVISPGVLRIRRSIDNDDETSA